MQRTVYFTVGFLKQFAYQTIEDSWISCDIGPLSKAYLLGQNKSLLQWHSIKRNLSNSGDTQRDPPRPAQIWSSIINPTAFDPAATSRELNFNLWLRRRGAKLAVRHRWDWRRDCISAHFTFWPQGRCWWGEGEGWIPKQNFSFNRVSSEITQKYWPWINPSLMVLKLK